MISEEAGGLHFIPVDVAPDVIVAVLEGRASMSQALLRWQAQHSVYEALKRHNSLTYGEEIASRYTPLVSFEP